MRAFLKSAGWTLAADFLGYLLLASLLVGGPRSQLFALLFVMAPVVMGAYMLLSRRT